MREKAALHLNLKRDAPLDGSTGWAGPETITPTYRRAARFIDRLQNRVLA